MKLAVIGYGKQGQRLARKFHELDVLWDIRDDSEDAMRQAEKAYPDTLVGWGREDAVAVATSSETHYDIAIQALLAGKDVFIEKPMTKNSEQARQLIETARHHERILMVGHNTLFSDGVAELKRRGRPTYYHSIRTNPSGYREDDTVLWRLLPHDIAVCLYLWETVPRKVEVWRDTKREIGVDLEFDDRSGATLIGSWSKARGRMRDVTVWFPNSPDGVPLNEGGDTLLRECQRFVECCQRRVRPISDGILGLEVVQVLELIERKLEERRCVR